MKSFAATLPDIPLERADLPAWGDAIRKVIRREWSDEPARWDVAILQMRGPAKRHPLDELFTEACDAAEGVVMDRAFDLRTVAIRLAPDVGRTQLKLLAI